MQLIQKKIMVDSVLECFQVKEHPLFQRFVAKVFPKTRVFE